MENQIPPIGGLLEFKLCVQKNFSEALLTLFNQCR